MSTEQGANPTGPHLSASDAMLGSKLIQTLERFRELDPEFQIQQVCFFLMVATKQGRATKQEIAEAIGISVSSATRNMQAFGKQHRSGKKGHDMIVLKANPAKTNQYLLELNAKGKRFYKSICEIF